jgi:predicted CXXCH cytochrome family protein
MTCNSCHTMHGGDPHGMIEPLMRTDAACLQCHESIGEDLRAHTHHEPQSSGSRCMECHMPQMVYGVLGIHRSHRIENPDPRRDGENGRPHACTTCHLDRSLAWSAEKMAEWWGPQYEPPRTRADGAPLELPDAVASMLGGDAVQRAVYAWAAGRTDSAVEAQDKALVRAALVTALADGYPSVRYLARNSLLDLERELPLGLAERLARWDHTDAASRNETARAMFDLLRAGAPGRLQPMPDGGLLDPDFSPRMDLITELLNLQDTQVISIGE